jgi:hypothetical protein
MKKDKKSGAPPIAPPEWMDPTSSEYMAVRIEVLQGKVAQRNEKTKENADPFVVLTYEHQQFQTKQLKNTMQPHWNETFEIPIPPESRSALGEVCLAVWDTNNSPKVKDQIFLGEIRIPLGDFGGVNFEYVQPRKYKLNKRGKPGKTDKVSGELNLKVGMVFPNRTKGRRVLSEDASTQEIIDEAEDVVDDSYETVMRTLKLTENTRQIAADTLETLGRQGDQLRNVQGDVDDIGELQEKADTHMRAINSLSGALANKFRRKKKGRDHVALGDKLAEKNPTERERLEEEAFKKEKREKSRAGRKAVVTTSAPANLDAKFKEDFGMLSEESQHKIKQTDHSLDRIGALLDDMKLIAVDMGDELDDHNRRLDILSRDVDKAHTKMKETNRKIQRNLD